MLVGANCSATTNQSNATTTPKPSTTQPTTTATLTKPDDPSRNATSPNTTTSNTTTTRPASPDNPDSPDTTGATGLGDSFYPTMGNGGYDALHYEIQLNINPTNNTIKAITTIKARATQQLSTFNLDLSGLSVDIVTVNGTHADFSRNDTELTVVTPEPLTAGAEFSTVVHYSGEPEPISDAGVPFAQLGWNNNESVIFTANEPSGSMSWFPSNNHPSDKATFEIHLTVPDSFTAAATGLLTNETRENGYTTTVWQMSDPMATYLAAVYVGEFERIETDLPNGPLIRDYIPLTNSEGIAEALAITPAVIHYFEELLGPYPYDVYGTIVMPFRLGFALENQTLSIHGRYAINPSTIAHEILHQWLGNSSTLDDWRDIWLHEGFATYLATMYMAEHHGWDLNEQMAAQHGYMAEVGSTPPRKISQAELFDASVYHRGALTLHALRNFVGDNTFLEILRTHYQQSAHANTNTAEFLEIVTQIAGSEATQLVESWLYDDPIPDLQFNL